MQTTLPLRNHGDVPYYLNYSQPGSGAQQHNIQLWHRFNHAEPDQRPALLQQAFSLSSAVFIEPAFFCQTPHNVRLGQAVFINHNTVLLGEQRLEIGDGVLIGPNCIITGAPLAGHPVSEAPVKIGPDVWIGANVLILPGSDIGQQAIIGAGSVVSGPVAAGTTFYNAEVAGR
ncbi:sugar O-acetyltransferase [Salinimonas marina]|uniref:Sugar O-acetyltransferase n=1 Tax=Salinimonas marina TaxID=2785918 RepID=A0A7S9HD75_9ALTE|nr:DapH/DapD/GlmU-related protein [Salinimonas marina]QPG05839.1 sugar O-acetyltransferase [Salinimonas marina]